MKRANPFLVCMKRLKLRCPLTGNEPTFPLGWNGPRSGHRQASQSDNSADL
jgi:hypothetical protein